VLLVLDRSEHAVWKSFRNLGARVQITLPEELNAHDVLLSDWLVFSTATLQSAIAHFSDGTATVAEAPAGAKPAAPAPVAAVETAEDAAASAEVAETDADAGDETDEDDTDEDDTDEEESE
jgi:hypothetical protein